MLVGESARTTNSELNDLDMIPLFESSGNSLPELPIKRSGA